MAIETTKYPNVVKFTVYVEFATGESATLTALPKEHTGQTFMLELEVRDNVCDDRGHHYLLNKLPMEMSRDWSFNLRHNYRMDIQYADGGEPCTPGS